MIFQHEKCMLFIVIDMSRKHKLTYRSLRQYTQKQWRLFANTFSTVHIILLWGSLYSNLKTVHWD